MNTKCGILLFLWVTLVCLGESFTVTRVGKRVHHTLSAREQESEDNTMGTWNPISLAVLKLGFTEPAWTSVLNYKNANGIYKCAYCKTSLFSSSAKYDSGSGWPSFWKTIAADRVSLKKELGGRIECRCANCGGHLGEDEKNPLFAFCTINVDLILTSTGHVFPDGPTRGSLNKGTFNLYSTCLLILHHHFFHCIIFACSCVNNR